MWDKYFTINKMKVFAKAVSRYLNILYILIQFRTKPFYWNKQRRVTWTQSSSFLPFCLLVQCASQVRFTYSSSHVHCGGDCIYFEDPFLGHIIRDLNSHMKCPLTYFIAIEHAMYLNPIVSWASFALCRCSNQVFWKGFLTLLFCICFVLFRHSTIKSYKERCFTFPVSSCKAQYIETHTNCKITQPLS